MSTAVTVCDLKNTTGSYPENWQLIKLGSISEFITSGSRGWARYYSDNGALFIRSQNVRDGRLDLKDRQLVTLPQNSEGSRTRIRLNDTLITITGNSVGNVALVNEDFIEAYISQHVGLVRLHNPSNAKFISIFLSPGSPGNGQIQESQSGQSKPGLTLKNLQDFLVALPPVSEQRSIATALSDMDALISGLDQLIAKKRDIKQATMQQLLTGKKRLPGFSGEWEMKTVSELGKIVTGGTPRTDIKQFWGEGYPWITPTDISSCRDLFESDRSLTQKGLGTIRELPENTVLVTCIASIGKNAILRSIGGCNQQINAVIPNASSDANFLYYLFDKSSQYLMANAGTTATSIISKTVFSELTFKVPPYCEQSAIAAILSDMDAELSTLESRRNKAKQLKQGMMQELLTGRIRLI